MEKWVPVLKPGKYRLADGREVRYTAADAENVVTQLKRQLKVRLRVPSCWMHDPDAQPYRLSHEAANRKGHQPEKAKNFIGDVTDARVENGVVVAKLHFKDRKDYEQFKKVDGVSPCLIRDWTDETGKTWPGLSIFHVAATPQPIQRDLPRPSEYRPTAPAYLSHSSPSAHRLAGRLDYLSQYLGGSDMADEKDDDDKKPADETEAETPDTETESSDQPEPPEVETVDEHKGGGQKAMVAKAVELAAMAGLHIGEVSTWKEFLIGFESAIKTQSGGDAGGEQTDNLSDANTEAVQQPAMYMSHQLTPAQMKAGAKISLADRAGKIQALVASTRITKPMGDDLLKRHKAEEVSFQVDNLSHDAFGPKFTADGLLKPTDLDAEIRAYEKLPAGKFKTGDGQKDNLSHTAPVAEPADKEAEGRAEAVKLAEEYGKKYST